MSAVNRGFVFEDGDPSVGIFGSAWYHETCESDNIDDSEVDEAQIATVRRDPSTIVLWYLLTCGDCAQQAIVFEAQWDPDDEAMNAMEADRIAAERAEQALCDRADREAEHAEEYVAAMRHYWPKLL